MKITDLLEVQFDVQLDPSAYKLPEPEASPEHYATWSNEDIARDYVQGIIDMAFDGKAPSNETLLAVVRGQKFPGYRDSIEDEYDRNPQEIIKYAEQYLRGMEQRYRS